MFTVDGLNITITRGDTGTLEIVFTGDRPLAANRDTVIAALKKTASRKDAIWEKTLIETETGTGESGAYSKYELELESSDTESLSFGAYCWDFRILYGDGQITTPFRKPAVFTVTEVATNLPGGDDGP